MMVPSYSLGLVLLLAPLSVFTQTPLFESVDSGSLFDYETLQLTKGAVASLSSDDGSDFGFPTEQVGLSSRCKTFPTDTRWPSDAKWKLLNKYVGGALIKTIPLGAPCYPGPLYDQLQCAFITANWANSSLQ